MFIYNISFALDSKIQDDWVSWCKETYLPSLLGQVSFQKHILLKLLADGVGQPQTYCCQFTFESIVELDKFRKQQRQHLSTELAALFGEECMFFDTILKEA